MREETVSEEQVLFNKLRYDDQRLIIGIMKTLQPCETEKEKKIPEKINKNYNIRILDLDKPYTIKDYDMEQLLEMVQDIYEKQGEICDYLKSKGE